MQPLADLLRPNNLNDFLGQADLVGENGVISKLIEEKKLFSMIFWGPPASGKTSLARIIANSTEAEFLAISAVMEGKEDLKKVLKIAEQNQKYDKNTILFIDEIHRWSKAQQDALLPYVEDGTITLIGATTENPSFTVISALLSRMRVFIFKPHTKKDILKALEKGYQVITSSSGMLEAGSKSPGVTQKKTTINLQLLNKNLAYIAQLADGDMRFALNTLEIALNLGNGKLDEKTIQKASQKFLLYDKNGEEHYNIISAVHKSLRSSNATAGVYWIMRMLQAGEDPLYVARRLLRFASEDIGNVNPNALLLANQTFQAVQNLGMPECQTALIQLAEYLAKSPKNNSAYVAMQKAQEDIQKYGNLPVPLHFRNAPTKLMKEIGYGQNYQYDHDLPGKKSTQECMPEGLEGRDYFDPSRG